MPKKNSHEDFHDLAVQYRTAAGELAKPLDVGGSIHEIFHPLYFLVLHAIELALKGFLLRGGVSGADLRSRNFGHDLEKLVVEADRKNLLSGVIQQDDIGGIRILRDYRKKYFEYPDALPNALPIKRLLDISRKLNERLDAP